jgi:glycosyltransferase involved in cell wall biosynthesis
VSESFDLLLCLQESVTESPRPVLNDPEALITVCIAREKPTEAANRAIRRAIALRRHLLVAFGELLPSPAILSELFAAFESDPLFGSAQPRFRSFRPDTVHRLPFGPQKPVALDLLPRCPHTTITSELLAGCMLLRWSAIASIDYVESEYDSAEGVLLHMLCHMRRRGFRNVVVNNAVLPTACQPHDAYRCPPQSDLEQLNQAFPEHALAEIELAQLPRRRYEALASAEHGRILIDCRDIPPRHNGSTQCALGFLDGFAVLPEAPRIELVVSDEASQFHQMRSRYASLASIRPDIDGEYVAAITLTQPWSLRALRDLHNHALVLAFMMLDTIAWDILYPEGAESLSTVWRFIARQADGLFYISEFTKQRFHARFPVHASVAERVTYLSLSQQDYVDPVAQATPPNGHILVFGNSFEHKDVTRTAKLLGDAFPFTPILAFGAERDLSPTIQAIPSGQLGQSDLHRLIAGARLIVYPSYYEGFGLPVVEGLAYGRPVVVRSSPLWSEIAGHSQLPGPMIEFDDAASLVQAVGRVLAGLPQPAVEPAPHLDEGAPPDWRSCAGSVLDLLDECIGAETYERWLQRDEAADAVAF